MSTGKCPESQTGRNTVRHYCKHKQRSIGTATQTPRRPTQFGDAIFMSITLLFTKYNFYIRHNPPFLQIFSSLSLYKQSDIPRLRPHPCEPHQGQWGVRRRRLNTWAPQHVALLTAAARKRPRHKNATIGQVRAYLPRTSNNTRLIPLDKAGSPNV